MNNKVADILINISKILMIAVTCCILLFMGYVVGDMKSNFRAFDNMKVRTVYRDTCLQINQIK